MRFFTLLSFILVLLVHTVAQTPTLVKELNTTPVSTNPSINLFLGLYNGSFFFTGQVGSETATFKSDGTDTNTTPFAAFSVYESVVLSGQTILSDYIRLWKTDGTGSGTTLLYEQEDFTSITSLTVIGSTLYFVADSSVGKELWKTDGTTSGTSIVKDINSGAAGSNTSNLTVFQGKLFFSADDGNKGQELWVSDGTAAGTIMLKDIALGSSNSNPNHLFVHNLTLYFSAGTSATGVELWKSDGTTGNTVQVLDIATGSADSDPQMFCTLSGVLLFACKDTTHGMELWKTDGTAAGTSMVKDIFPGIDDGIRHPYYTPFVSGSKIYFEGSDGSNGRELWISDGTLSGTNMLKNIEPGAGSSIPKFFRQLGSSVIFTANTSTQGAEMWTTDGTAAGTNLIVDLAPGTTSAVTDLGPVYNNRLYFSNVSDDQSLWSTNGTSAGTIRVTNRTGSKGSNPAKFSVNGSKLFFQMDTAVTDTYTLGVSDGTVNGTIPLNPASLRDPIEVTAVGSNTFFLAGWVSGAWAYELWKTDGTLTGTQLVKSYSPGFQQTIPHLTSYQNKVYFMAVSTVGPLGDVIWSSDGTLAGTTQLTGIGTYDYLCEYNNKLIYYESVHAQTWISDGTAAGTSVLANGSVFNGFHEVNGKLIHSDEPSASGEFNLYIYDGVTTTLLKTITTGQSGFIPSSFTNVGSLLYFLTTGSSGNTQLWKTDGTSANTQKVADLSTRLDSLIGGFDNKVYFSQETSEQGNELWVSDGTALGTKLVIDTFPGIISGLKTGWIVETFEWAFENRLYFSVWQPGTGAELWTSDGTASGTHILSDLIPGGIGNLLSDAMAIDHKLYFTAASSGNNRELWTIPILPNAAIRTTTPYVCPSTSSLTASVMVAIGSATYSWTATNATITSGSNTPQITYTSGSSGQVQLNVTVTDSGGISQKTRLLPIRTNLTSTGAISGPSDPCIGSQATYLVPANPDVDTFTWQVPLTSTITSGQGTNQINVTVGSNSGQVSVVAQNPCSTTGPSNLAIVPVNGMPSAPASVSGPQLVCASQTGVAYATPNVSGVTSYTWTVPSGATITQGQGTPSILVTFGSSSGSTGVLATNGCGSSQPLTIVVNVSAQPSTSNAGPDQNLPSGQVAQLNANQPVVGIGAWSVVSGPSTQPSQFSSLNSNTSTFTPLVSSGTYTLRWTISNGGCSDSVDELLLVYSSPQNVDLVLQLSCIQNSPSVGEPTEFTVLLSNNGTTTATGIQVTLNIHPEIEVSSHTLTHGTYFPTQAIWEIAALPAGALATLTPSGHAISLGDKPIVAEVTQCNEPDINSTPNNHLLAEDDQDQCSWQPAAFVNIPDPALKLLITSDPTMDTFDDDEISPFEASGINFVDCSYQGVADLTGLETFVNLQFLGASGNPIIELPGLQGLTALTSVFLDDCKLTSLNDSMGNFALPIPIITLSLAGNRLTHIPMEVFFMTFMQSLWLNSNPWGQVEDSFDMFPDLKFLNLSNTGLKQIPSSIGFHLGLEHIIIGLNDIRELPFILPATLKFIDLSGNKISDISPLEFCPQLEGVILFNNNLEDLTALTSIPGLLTVGSHYAMVDRNRLNSSACPEIATLVARSSSSGAYFEYNPQGDFSFLYNELPEWEVLPHRLLKWVNDVNMEAYLYNISCP